jgi:4-amino-4-deoxy-L-arabinose transferase-like glycosyltransferase
VTFSLAAPKKLRHVILALTLLTSLKIAIFLALDVRGAVRPFVGDNAKAHYLPIASRLFTEGRFNGPDSRPDSKIPPGYPVVIAIGMGLTQAHILALLVVFQMIFDLGTALIIYWMAGRLGCSTAGFWAGLVWLLFPPEVVISTWITAECMFTFLLVLAIALLLRASENQELGQAAMAGCVLGLATLFRATPLWLPLFFLPIFVWFRRLRVWFAAGVVMACLILPWTLRNWIVLDDFIPVAVGSGSFLLQGSDERFFAGSGKMALYPEVFEAAGQAGIRKPASDHESGIDAWMGRVGLWTYRQRLEKRPLSLLPFLVYKSLRLWYGAENASPAKQFLVGLCSFLVVPAGFWQLWRSRSRKSVATYLLLGCLAYFFLVHVVLLPEVRYVIPIYPLIILSACTLYRSRIQMLAGHRNLEKGPQ